MAKIKLKSDLSLSLTPDWMTPKITGMTYVEKNSSSRVKSTLLLALEGDSDKSCLLDLIAILPFASITIEVLES